MRRVWIALAAALGFAVAFLATWIVGVWHNQSPECDGVCVDMFAIIGVLALVFGVLGAFVGGFATSAILERYFDPPSA